MRAWQSITFGTAAAAVLIAAAPARAVPLLPACNGDAASRQVPTCIAAGDRGWDEGSRWRLKDTDAPEIGRRTAACRAEQIMGVRARDRLRVLMSLGYTITFTGRSDTAGWPLATIRLSDGRDASAQMMSEGMVQAAPNTRNRWCQPDP